MNIFILADLPTNRGHAGDYLTHLEANAAAHCDRHVISQIKESVQMLVTVLHTTDRAYLGKPPAQTPINPCQPLAAGHAKHPCVDWAFADSRNMCYLARLANALCEEKERRWPMNPRHEYTNWVRNLNAMLSNKCSAAYWDFPSTFAVAVKDEALKSSSTPAATALEIYRDYYIRDKSRFATWKAPASKPEWFLS